MNTPVEKIVGILLEQEQVKVRCREGWIYYSLLAGGRYYVTATGHTAKTIPAAELRGYVDELVRYLGGRSRHT